MQKSRAFDNIPYSQFKSSSGSNSTGKSSSSSSSFGFLDKGSNYIVNIAAGRFNPLAENPSDSDLDQPFSSRPKSKLDK